MTHRLSRTSHEPAAPQPLGPPEARRLRSRAIPPPRRANFPVRLDPAPGGRDVAFGRVLCGRSRRYRRLQNARSEAPVARRPGGPKEACTSVHYHDVTTTMDEQPGTTVNGEGPTTTTLQPEAATD